MRARCDAGPPRSGTAAAAMTRDDHELAGRVLEHLDLDRAVRLTQEVCRIPSVLGEEGPLAAFLADVMKRPASRRWNSSRS